MPIFLFLSSQCQALGSRFGTQLVNTKALYNVFVSVQRSGKIR
ncbi:MAG: hypothetical protein ACR5LA_12585 [Wolbachia sp.]